MSETTHHASSMTVGMYLKIYAILMIGLIATIGAVYIHMGFLNFPVAMAIASFKALVVIMYFMHVKFAEKTIWIFSATGFLWLAYLLVGFAMDYLSRFAG